MTSDDLVVGLRSCLAATHKFGRLALPLFLDKLQASSDKAKRQTLEALVACFPVYGAAISGEWAGRFSEACTVEVFHPTSEEISALALETLRTLFATLYPDEAPVHRVHVNDSEGDAEMEVAMDEEAEVKGIAVDVVANAMNELREPDKRDAGEAVKLVCAAIASSRRVARYAFAVALPPLLSIFKSQDDISLRPSVLEHVSSMLAALARLPPPPDPDEPSPLNPYRDDLLSVLASGTRTATCRHPAIAALVHAFHVAYFLDPLEEVPFVVAALKDALDAVAPTVANGGGDAAVYDATLDALVEASKLYPHAIEKAVLPAKFALLPDADDPLASLNAPNELASAPGMPPAHIRALASLAALCVPPDLFEILALRVLARLERVGALAPADPRDAALGAKYAHELLATLRAALVQKARAGHDDVARYVDRFLPNFVAIFIAPTVRPPLPGAPPSIASDSRLLQDAGNVLQLIVQRLPLEGQRNLVEALHRAFHSGEISALVPSWRAAEGDLPFAPFSVSCSTCLRSAWLLTCGGAASEWRGAAGPYPPLRRHDPCDAASRPGRSSRRRRRGTLRKSALGPDRRCQGERAPADRVQPPARRQDQQAGTRCVFLIIYYNNMADRKVYNSVGRLSWARSARVLARLGLWRTDPDERDASSARQPAQALAQRMRLDRQGPRCPLRQAWL